MLHIDANLLIVFAIVWILVAVLTKTFYNPIRRVMGDREKGIQDNLTAGQKAVEEYEQAVLKIDSELKAARSEAHGIRERLEQEAAQERERLLAEVSKAYRAGIDEAKKELEKQVEELKKDMAARSDELAAEIEKRLLK